MQTSLCALASLLCMLVLPVRADEADGQKPPEVIHAGLNLYYPDAAKVRGLEGRVLVAFKISSAGRVVDARIADSEPKGIFEKTSTDEMRSWRFAVPKGWNSQREWSISFVYGLTSCRGIAAAAREPYPSDYKPVLVTGSRIGC